jgi:hypothetical protein
MKESYGKGVANHPDPESCVASRKAAIEALTTNTVARQVSRPCTIGGSISMGSMYGPSPVRKVVAALIRYSVAGMYPASEGKRSGFRAMMEIRASSAHQDIGLTGLAPLQV